MISSCSVVGLGKLGSCMAACMADKGFPVIGVDVSPTAIAALNAGHAPIYEPHLAEMIARNRSRLRATSDYRDAIANSDATFIVVPTPSEEDGSFSLRYVSAAIESIGLALREKNGFHLVVLTSTVLPLATDRTVRPLLEEVTGKVAGVDFGLCYNPEFIALGSVIHDFLNPDFILIGESDKRSGDLLAPFYETVCDNAPAFARMNFANAELAKIAVNTYVTTKITFANTLAELCEQLPGGDVDVVTQALGSDSRIGRRYLKGGLGYGGPCFPRDNIALSSFAKRVDRVALIGEATDRHNREMADRMVERVLRWVTRDSVVAVLGLSYKPHSNVVEESQALYLAQQLAAEGVRVVVHDPVALDNARKALGDRVSYASDLRGALSQADVVVVANADEAYCGLEPADFPVRPVVVFDCWRLLRRALQGVAGIDYVPFGVGRERVPAQLELTLIGADA